MLLARLAVGAIRAATAGYVAALLARDRGQAAWWLGSLFVLLSLPNHLYPGYVWNDYPVWYHLLYLSYLVPAAGLAGRFASKTIRSSSTATAVLEPDEE